MHGDLQYHALWVLAGHAVPLGIPLLGSSHARKVGTDQDAALEGEPVPTVDLT